MKKGGVKIQENCDVVYGWFSSQNKSQVMLWKMYVLFHCTRHKVTKILTCCIVFQFESSSSVYIIRMKINKEVVAWGYLARWGGMTIFSNYWRCHWTSIIHGQFIIAETIIPISFTVFIMVKIKASYHSSSVYSVLNVQ